MNSLLQDLRYARRMLWKNPGFTLVAVLSLGLGTGANTAIFQLLDAVRLRHLPVRQPEQLVDVEISDLTGLSGSFEGLHPDFSYPSWERIRDRQQPFSTHS